jgi:hypothetical protein
VSNEELFETLYAGLVQALTDNDRDKAVQALGALGRPELDLIFDRATREQVIREDLRELIVNLIP